MPDTRLSLDPDWIDERAVRALNDRTLAGLAVGVVRDGRLVYARGFGEADIASHRPLTPDTTFRIGSISKTVTAVGAMRLWEEGRLDLDAHRGEQVVDGRVEGPSGAPPVTVRHLLTHTAGIGELRSFADLLPGRVFAGLGTKPGQPSPPPPAYYGGVLRAELAPGQKWAYANHGFNVLGQLIEDVSGEPFDAYLRRTVFEPLGMHHTDYLRSDRVRGTFATGYGLRRGRLVPAPDIDVAVRPAGSIFSSVADMARYAAMLLGGGALDGARVLEPETLARMFVPHYQPDPRLPGIGLAFFVERIAGHRVVSHDGGWPGFVSAMYLAPDAGVGVLVFTNSSDQAPDFVARDVLARLLDVPERALALPRPGVPEHPGHWPDQVGAYGPRPGLLTNARLWLGAGGEFEVVVKDHHLYLKGIAGLLAGGMRLYPTDPNDPDLYTGVVENLAPLSVAFQRDPDGRVDRLVIGGLIMATLFKRHRLQTIKFRATAAATVAAATALAATALKLRRR